MEKDSKIKFSSLKVDGGASVNNLLMQKNEVSILKLVSKRRLKHPGLFLSIRTKVKQIKL